MGEGVDRRNGSGYVSPTEYTALTNIERCENKEAEKRLSELIRALKRTIDDSGFDLLARIEVKDRKTGRCFR